MTEQNILSAAVTVLRAEQPFTVEMPRCDHYIDGRHVESATGETSEVVDPARGTVLATVPRGGAAEVDAAVAAARAAAPGWATRTPKDRAEVLLALADALRDDRDRLRTLEALNCGKPPAVTADDVDSAIDTFRFMAGAGRSTTTVAAGDYVEDITSMILREPLGVIGMITPWNYPLLMVAWKLAPALMVGNTIVLKPSEVTPLTTLRLAELADGILPPGVLNIVNGSGSTVGAALSAHPGIDMIALTGSVGAGRSVAGAAAANVVPAHLELGGKAPVLVCPDADLDQVAATVAEAGFWNTGQECGAACRVLAHDSIAEALTEKIVTAVAAYRLAAPEIDQDDTLGPIIYRGHYERVMTAIHAAVDRGAEVLLGARGDDSEGYWIEPTVLKVATGDPISL
ncbi:aldehyde dehydrogenase family protein, partial [Citricoccus sp.]|uniref:aldehyde dehydrogenase family protein n=1 Tax=Citricoccus sp. TaxID=1978372 RepID=UPI002C26322A